MVSKPSVYPVWAENDVVDPVSGENNVITPPAEKQLIGWSRLEYPPRNWFNWLARYTSRWIQWFDQQESQKIVISDNTGTIPIANVITGGMFEVSVIDTTTPANFFRGITYIPPSPGAPIAVSQASANVLTVSNIAVDGTMTVSGGSGNFIIKGQMSVVP